MNMNVEIECNMPPPQYASEHEVHHPDRAPNPVERVDSIDNKQNDARAHELARAHAERTKQVTHIREKIMSRLVEHKSSVMNILSGVSNSSFEANIIRRFVAMILRLAEVVVMRATTKDGQFMKVVDFIFHVLLKSMQVDTIVYKKFGDTEMRNFIIDFTGEMRVTIEKILDCGRVLYDELYCAAAWSVENYNDMMTVMQMVKMILALVAVFDREEYSAVKIKKDFYLNMEIAREHVREWNNTPTAAKLAKTIRFKVAGFGKHTTTIAPDKPKVGKKPALAIKKTRKTKPVETVKATKAINTTKTTKATKSDKKEGRRDQDDLDACAILLSIGGM